MSGLADRLLDVIYPPSCPCCATLQSPDEPVVCACCTANLSPMPTQICLRCGRPPEQCDCRSRPHLFDRAVSAYWYAGPVRKLVQQMKYQNDRRSAAFLADAMAQAVETAFGTIEFTGVVAVPMAPLKRLMRGYNQADRLARLLADRLGLPLLAKRLERTALRQQHHLSAQTRLTAAHKGYRLRRGAAPLFGRILLVDDVQTTGATLDRCAFLLRQLGAQEVYCVCAACTPLTVSIETQGKKSYNKEYGPVLQDGQKED